MKKTSSRSTQRKKKFAPLPRWKKVLLGVAGALLVGGLGLKAYELTRPDGPAPGSPENAAMQPAPASSLVDGWKWPREPELPPKPEPDEGRNTASEDLPTAWSGALTKGGFSFLVAFCIGYALRAFFKISALVLGVVALAIFALSYFGVLQVDWTTLETYFDRAAKVVKEEGGGLTNFVTGSLPSAGMAGLGLFTGFKKNK